MGDKYGVVANVVTDRVLRVNAKVWIIFHNGDAEHPIVKGLNKGGGFVTKYTNYKKLRNLRPAWIPEHLRPEIQFAWDTKEEAQHFADAMVNYFPCLKNI